MKYKAMMLAGFKSQRIISSSAYKIRYKNEYGFLGGQQFKSDKKQKWKAEDGSYPCILDLS